MPTYKAGTMQLTMDDTLSDIMRRAIEKVRPGLVARLEREGDEVLADALVEWPRVSGRSADSLKRVTRLVGRDVVKVSIVSDVDYVVYIKPKKWYANRSAVVELLRKPIRKRAGRLAEQLAEETMKRLGR